MRGHRHHRAVAVVGQHIVGRPDRHPLAVDRVDRGPLQRDARLDPAGVLTLDLRRLLHLGQVRGEGLLHGGRRPRGQLGGQLGIGRDDHEGRAEQGVGPGREDRDLLVVAFDDEVDVDPLQLHPRHDRADINRLVQRRADAQRAHPSPHFLQQRLRRCSPAPAIANPRNTPAPDSARSHRPIPRPRYRGPHPQKSQTATSRQAPATTACDSPPSPFESLVQLLSIP